MSETLVKGDRARYAQLLREKLFLQENLPFFYDPEKLRCNLHKFYKFQIEFLESVHKITLLTAANQIGKSSIQIIKALNLGLRPELWPKYFKRKPQLFLYYMPDSSTMDVEFDEKWIKTYLPKEALKDHPVWGWKVEYDKPSKREGVSRLYFPATGVTILFKYYSQLPQRVQAVTADLVLLDEECPKSHWDELMIRSLVFGSVSMVFTATIGQLYLYKAMMLRGTKEELFPDALKRTVSMYDCIFYADGSPSGLFTKEKIEKEIMPTFSSKAEIDKRVFGLFVKTDGILYAEFDEAQNTCDYKISPDWRWVAGLDFGSGGKYGHASSICLCQVSPCYSMARVVKTFHSGQQRFTQGDLLNKYKEMTMGLEVVAYFDWAATDLGEIALREGMPMYKANKNHDIGVPLLNTLFKNRQLGICTGDKTMQNQQLIQELRTISSSTLKKHRTDDCADALRYCLSSIEFRFTPLTAEEKRKVVEITDPRMRFWKGLDRPGDPMKIPEQDLDAHGDFDLEYLEAFKAYEDIL